MATTGTIGEIGIFAYDRIPRGWEPCDGQLLLVKNYQRLFELFGNIYGGDGQKTFAVPDLRGRLPLPAGKDVTLAQIGGEEQHALTAGEMAAHAHQAFGTTESADSGDPTDKFWASNTGKNPYATKDANASMASQTIGYTGIGTGHENMSPFLALKYAVCTDGGIFGKRDGTLGDIMMYAGKKIISDQNKWLPCDGRTLQISEGHNSAFFAVIGTQFGGNGSTTFKLPDLQGIAVIQVGKGQGLTERQFAEGGGSAVVTLTEDQLAEHTHQTKASSAAATSSNPTSSTWAVGGETRGGVPLYSGSETVQPMNADALTKTGGGRAHNNMPPFLGINFLICVEGAFPSRP